MSGRHPTTRLFPSLQTGVGIAILCHVAARRERPGALSMGMARIASVPIGVFGICVAWLRRRWGDDGWFTRIARRGLSCSAGGPHDRA